MCPDLRGRTIASWTHPKLGKRRRHFLTTFITVSVVPKIELREMLKLEVKGGFEIRFRCFRVRRILRRCWLHVWVFCGSNGTL